ncbi:MAG: helix-turn-helix domain-containing protein [Chitinophagaceae bacterium]|nr:helix-turn-helix domain-containing protein [Rubrivivax sp.]
MLRKVPLNSIGRSCIEGIEMPRRSPFHIELSTEEAAELNRRAVRYTLPYFEVIRAKMILLAAQGIDNDEIAAHLDTRREVVSQWRKRFFTDRLAGLDERVRPGRPRTHAAAAQR